MGRAERRTGTRACWGGEGWAGLGKEKAQVCVCMGYKNRRQPRTHGAGEGGRGSGVGKAQTGGGRVGQREGGGRQGEGWGWWGGEGGGGRVVVVGGGGAGGGQIMSWLPPPPRCVQNKSAKHPKPVPVPYMVGNRKMRPAVYARYMKVRRENDSVTRVTRQCREGREGRHHIGGNGTTRLLRVLRQARTTKPVASAGRTQVEHWGSAMLA